MLPFEQDSAVSELPFEQAQSQTKLPFEQDETTLFSKRGVASLLGQIGPNIAIGVLGSRLAELENVKRSRDKKRLMGEEISAPGYSAQEDIELEQRIRETRTAIEEGKRHVAEITGTPSTPLRLAQGVTQSFAQNAPGVALAVSTRGAGGPGIAPAIIAAEQQSSGQAYAEARIPSDPTKPPAPVEESLIHADVSGKAEAVFELMPLAKLAQEVGKEGLATLIRNYVLREWATEIPTTVAQDLSEWSTTERDMPFREFMAKVGQDVVDTAIITPFAAGGTAALARAQYRAGQAEGPTAIGPSGEGIYGENMLNISPAKTPPVPFVPRPVPTQPVLTETQALIASIDASLADPEGISNDQVEISKQQIAAFEKARNAPAREENTALLAGLDELTPQQELGQSAKSTRNAPNYAPNPNDAATRSQRVVSYTTAQGVETGLSLAQTPMQPGVYVVGEPSEDREGPILQAAADTLEQWRAKFLPDRPLLLMNESLPYGNAVGWHWTNGNVHAITPAALRQFTGQGADAFNANAQVTFFYNLSHEFGHSLLEDRFFNEGLPQQLTQALKTESSKGSVSEATLTALEAVDPARAAVVREYNSIRERVMSNNMTAREFQLEWMGPHQAGRRQMFGKHDYKILVPDEAPALQLVDKIMQRALGSKTPLPSDQLNPMRAEFLSLHEYAANQMARYAYARKFDESSPFNKDTLFARAFQSLRNALAEFFSFLKREGDIAPNTTFAEWLDGLSTSGDRTPRAGKKARAKPAPKKAPKAVKSKPVEEVDHNVETVSEARVKYLRTLLTGLVRNKTLDVGDDTYKRLMGLLKAGDYSTFVDEIQPMLEKKVKWELDDEVPELKAGADMNRMIDLVGYKMYEQGLGGTIIKETLQNSVDAVLDELKVNPKTFAEINFAVDPNARTITVIDTGKGMTLQDVATKFLQLGAKGKGVGSAGGFGLAKAAFLFGPERVQLRTVHNGTAVTLEATQADLRAQKDLRKQASIEKVKEPNGTALKVWLPQKYTSSSGESRDISMPSSYDLERMKLLAPITVTWQNAGREPRILPIGENFDLSKYEAPVEITFEWGRAMLHIGKDKLKYGGDHSVLSRGVPQFHRTFYEKGYDPFKRHIILDIQPTVEAAHRLYPFNLQRENFAPIIEKTDIKALEAYISRIAGRQAAERTRDVFSKIKGMRRVAGTTRAAEPKTSRVFEKRDFNETPLTPQEVKVLDGKLYIDNEIVFDAAKTAEYSGSMQAPEIDMDDLFLEIGASPDEPLFHNNTNFDPIAWGKDTGHEDAGLLLAKLGSVVLDFRDFIANARSLASHKERILTGFAGVSLDKGSADNYSDGYAGVNLALPYTGMFINPLYQGFDVQNSADFVGLVKYTLVHEAAHYSARGGHGDEFVAKEGELFRDIEGMGGLGQFTDALNAIVEMHFDTLQAMRLEYAEPSYTNTGDSLEGESIRGPAGLARSGESASQSGRQESGGSVFGRTGRVRFELDDLGESFPSVRVAGLPEHAARRSDVLADAQAKWQQLGFRSPYFKAWFGDWEQREGSRVVTAGDTPLTVFHASDAKVKTPQGFEPFTSFEQGDMGFHFGTLRAAHNRGFAGVMQVPEEPVRENGRWVADVFKTRADTFLREAVTAKESYIIPAVLNIRNPIVFGEENPGMWVSPRAMLTQMAIEGVSPFSLAEANKIIQETEDILRSPLPVDKFEQFRPLREALLAKGFDGMQYVNTQEGDISWVAFKPEQIKSLLGNKTFSQSKDFHWELDFDNAQPDGFGASRMNRLFSKWMPAQFRRSLRWITNLQFKTLQLQQLSHLHPDLTDLAYMNEKNYEYNRYKGSLQAQPDQVLAEWSELGKENFAHVNKFLQTEAEGSELWFDLVREGQTWVYRPNAKTLEKMAEFGLQPQTPEGEVLGKLILDAKNALLHQVNEAERVLKHLLARRYGGNQAALTASFTVLTKEMHEIRKRPFFPQGRFGNYVLTVEKKRDGAAGYEVVYREAFESREEWDEAWQKANGKTKPDERVRKFELTDTEYVMMSLPQDFIEIAVSELGLTEEQRDTLIAITQPVRKEKALRSYDQTRLGIKGYSADAMRSFANFTWHNANLLAKLRFRSEFNMAIQGINAKLRDAQFSDEPQSLNEVERLTRVKRYMERSRDFIMAPPNEAHMARAFVSIAYLGFNIKTALVNFYGLVTTWSDITSKLGQVEGNKVFVKALRGMWSSVRLTDLNAVKRSDALSEELQAGLDRAVQEGVLTQSYAYHLAGMANASNLYRMPSRQVLGKITHKAIDLAMWTFRLAELGARRATFIAQLDLASREQGLGFTDAYTAAVTATNKLQNDYSLGNRVPFMRGIKTHSGNPMVEGAVPIATIFMSFAQHMAFHAYGGYELGQRRADRIEGKTPSSIIGGYTMKIWLLTLLLAGYEGLPGAENLLDLIDIMWKKFKGKPARQELREMVQAVGADPVWTARGLGHNVAGFDVSRSLGFGRMIPGTDVLNKTQTDINRTLGNVVFDLAGPAGNMAYWGLSTFAGDRPIADGMKRAPGAIGNVWNAYTWSQQGVRAPSGAEITFDLDTGKLRDLTTVEVFGKALGFNPTVVSQNREVLFQQHDLRMYWLSRRDRLLDDMWRATWQRDREAIADVNKSITEFNGEIPEDYKRSLRITPRDIFNSRRNRARTKRLEELQLPSQRRYRDLYRDVRESFETP
jgi:hypothetical protein